MAGVPVPVPFNPNGFVNFSPYGTIVVNANGTSSSAAFTTLISQNANSVMVFNETTKTVYVAFGSSKGGNTVTAATPTSTEANNSTPVGAGAILFFTKLGSTTPNAVNATGVGQFDTMAAIAPNGATGNVYFTAGDGA